MLGPVQVDFLRPTIQRALAEQLKGFTVDFEHTVLVWGGWSRAIDVRVTNVVMKDRHDLPVIELPQLAVGFKPSNLAKGNYVPRRIEFFSPVIMMSRKADGSFILRRDDRGPQGSDVFEQLLKSMLEPPSDRNDLRRLAITDAVIDIDDLAGEENWRVSGAALDVRRTGSGLTATLAGTLDGANRRTGFTLRGDFSRATSQAALTLDLTGAIPSMFARPEGGLAVLRGWNLPVSGRVTANAHPDGHVNRIDFDLTAARGKLTIPALEAPLTVDGAILKGGLDRASGRLSLDLMRLTVGEAVIAGKGALFTSPSGEGGIIDATLENLPFTTVSALWPPGFKPGTRRWFSRNIVGGTMTSGQIKVDVQPTAPGAPAKVDFGLDFEFSGMVAHYLRPMPSISRGTGRASLRPQFFELWVDEGVIADPANGMSVDITLHGLIDHLDQKTDHVADLLLALDTDVPQLMTLLDYKPLGYTTKFGVSPQAITGDLRGKLRLRIPLIKNLGMDDVRYEAAVVAENFLLTKGIEALEPQAGDLEMTLDSSGVVARGHFTLLGAPAVIDWTETFAEKVTPTRYTARAAIGPEAARKLGMPEVFEMGGTMETTTVLIGKGSRISKGTVQADLKNASFAFPIMSWSKPAGEPGTLAMDLSSQPGGLLPGRLSVSMPGLNTGGRLSFTETGDFSAIELPRLQLADTDIAFTLRKPKDGPLDMNVSGRKADLRPFLEDDEEDAKQDKTPEEEESTFAAAVTLDVDEAILPEGVPIRDMQAVVEIERGEVVDADVTGVLKSGKTMSVDFSLIGEKPGIEVVTDDAGELLRTVGVLNGVTGGSLHISGTISGPRGKRHTVGTISAKDFRVKDSPMMAQMLTIGSLSGLRDILTGDGIGFARFDTGFDMGEGTLRFEDARAFGSQLGIRMSGRIYDDTTRLDLDGTLAPAYTLNTVLDYVPIVGQILSGGENEGLIAIRFSVDGTTEKPDVSVNPLSALTPGFLRNMFNVFSSPPKDEKKEKKRGKQQEGEATP